MIQPVAVYLMRSINKQDRFTKEGLIHKIRHFIRMIKTSLIYVSFFAYSMKSAIQLKYFSFYKHFFSVFFLSAINY